MKVSLNASARDAQIRDSFNKESFVSVKGHNGFITFCELLYNLQKDLPRNASKLHSLVVTGEDGTSYLLNFEILRSSVLITNSESVIGSGFSELEEKSLKDLIVKKKKTVEKGVTENDN